ncbi:unnamed protein product [Owenia fusiformis]|uniref:Neurotransmitter-gated ion-channel ligand-binding domain-containing protein n=1 Tax=Owenia fusiformis TaxID=6347 RepID=A0A8S4Q7H7_OWEFU|nr:unnamed protein product [Owenia fusiformis]
MAELINLPPLKTETIQNDAHRDNEVMRAILERISKNLEDNTKAIKALAKSGSASLGRDGSAISKKPNKDIDEIEREDKVPVEIRVCFLKIVDVNTLKQVFVADIFIQAKWTEPELNNKTDSELEDLDVEECCWTPKILVRNIDGEPDEITTWYRCRRDPEGGHPVVYQRQRIKGTFIETLELKDFPVDVQELTLQVSTERSEVEVELMEDKKELSSINVDTFMDQQEWNVYEHVESELVPTTTEFSNSKFKHPKLNLMCHVSRKPGYFFWNIFLIMFMITSLTFVVYAIDIEVPQGRLNVNLTLLLTAVAFKFVCAQNLPTISYLTFLRYRRNREMESKDKLYLECKNHKDIEAEKSRLKAGKRTNSVQPINDIQPINDEKYLLATDAV